MTDWKIAPFGLPPLVPGEYILEVPSNAMTAASLDALVQGMAAKGIMLNIAWVRASSAHIRLVGYQEGE